MVLHAQYYYTDIISTQQTTRMMEAYLKNKITSVSATGFDEHGTRSTDFSEYQEIKDNGSVLRVSTIQQMKKTVSVYRFDQLIRPISITDSSGDVINTTAFRYNEQGLLIQLENKAMDSSGLFNHTETHLWTYNYQGKPEKMLRLIRQQGIEPNQADSLEIRFIQDEKGNPAEERTYKKNRETGYLYYYYDEKNRLTDIVRYNTRLKKLMPDVLFEYDENDRVIQKMTTTSSLNLGYLIWRYIYDIRGLKVKEALFNKNKQLTGRIEYSYR